ncbi:MDR family oxidoreductase [Noviherbaspirillum denitrificans]|uniref:NADPH:quinone dehydrogenase n=1 Tax=Noviherbaspirillum denitrificans TaxID=1968433 RepID=A0A254T6H1_9BURK|nr:MDR family oxidoreductase [Noviherbaspirillum denitrificans]OWW18269.1 NADPH:quinone dehydrogenase [Noviherbaspirillum denitrificans]
MFKALLLTRTSDRSKAELVDLDETALPPGDVDVRIEYSSLNFKDALAITGRGPIVKEWPMVAGIDLAGVVERSTNPAWKTGDRVVVNGWGLSETQWGGLSQRARLSANWLLKLPEAFDTRQAMAIGTAGYTAALCVRALLRHGLVPEKGPVLVTGAAGGVGSIAVVLLASLGFEVIASTGRPAETDYLRSLGATEVIGRETLSFPGKPLQKERWAASIDTVGSHTLVNALAATQWNGACAACGLAQGADLPATVMPFILRGVTLYGINCVFVPNEERVNAWNLLAGNLSSETLMSVTREIGLSQVVDAAADLLEGRLHGRTVVDVNR